MENLRKITIVVMLGLFIFGAVTSSSLSGYKKENGKIDATKK